MIHAMSTNATDLAPGTHPQQVCERNSQESPGDLKILQEVFQLADKAELTWLLEMSMVKIPDTVDNLTFSCVSHRRETPTVEFR